MTLAVVNTLMRDKSVLADFGCYLYVNYPFMFDNIPERWRDTEGLMAYALKNVDLKLVGYTRMMGYTASSTQDSFDGNWSMLNRADIGWIDVARQEMQKYESVQPAVVERDCRQVLRDRTEVDLERHRKEREEAAQRLEEQKHRERERVAALRHKAGEWARGIYDRVLADQHDPLLLAMIEDWDFSTMNFDEFEQEALIDSGVKRWADGERERRELAKRDRPANFDEAMAW